MKTHFSNKELWGALGENEQEAEMLLRDEVATETVMQKAKKLLEKIKKIPIIGGMIEEIETMIEMIRDYVQGSYKEAPLRFVVSAMGGIIYLISPIDLIPDVIPIIGFVDDAAVIGLILSTGLSSELRKYRKWKVETERQVALEKSREAYIKQAFEERVVQ